MAARNDWPRLALYDDWGFGIYQASKGAMIQLVKPGDPPVFFGTLQNLVAVKILCDCLGVDDSTKEFAPCGDFVEARTE